MNSIPGLCSDVSLGTTARFLGATVVTLSPESANGLILCGSVYSQKLSTSQYISAQ
jgi:hypothetical protein